MKRGLFIILLLALGLVSCGQSSTEDPLAVSSEAGVVTVFKSPT